MKNTISYGPNAEKSIHVYPVGSFYVAVEVLTLDAARVFFVLNPESPLTEVPIPTNVTMHGISEDGNEFDIKPHRNEFIVIWHRSYLMKINNEVALLINHRKEQSVIVVLKPARDDETNEMNMI